MDTRAVRLEWTGEGLRFRGGGTEPATPEIQLDGDGAVGPSPMQALLLSAAGCTGADVVVILEKMRVGLDRLSIDVIGTRRAEHPKRYESVSLTFQMSGAALDRTKAERAVALSVKIDVAYEIDHA